MFSLLNPTFSLPFRPYPLSLALQPIMERSPTDTTYDKVFSYLTASANDLVPLIFGAELLD